MTEADRPGGLGAIGFGIELDQEPAFLLSRRRIPPSPGLRPDRVGRMHWFSLDSEAKYRKRPHPGIGAEEVVYDINSDGYRCPELRDHDWETGDELKIVGIGSSGLFGAGLPEPDTFLARLAKQLGSALNRPVSHWNLGVGGSSADLVTRLLCSVLPVMRPDLVVLTTFPLNRRELFGETGRPFSVDAKPHWQHRLLDPERFAMHRAASTICNPFNNLMNLLVNMKTWESLCDDAGVPWLFMTESHTSNLEPLIPMLREPRKIVGPGIQALVFAHKGDPANGLARDFMHAGRTPNRLLAEQLIAALGELYPQRLEHWRRA